MNAGILRVSGSLAGAVQVNNGGTLGGSGTIGGGVIGGPGGVVEPGASIGAFSTLGALSFGTGSIFRLEIDSAAGMSDSISAVNVTIGTGVDLFGMEIGAGALPHGLQFKIIDNTSTDPTTRFFAGLCEGAQFPVGNNLFRISYVGGDGNDMTLTDLVPEPGAGVLMIAGGVALFARRKTAG